MEIFVTTDMQWSTPPLRRHVGRLAPDNPRLAEANRSALEELFTALPQISGVVVRIGEAGGAHDQGGDYSGHMIYRTAQDLRGLIATLLPVCERYGRLLVARTWSIGIGELGDLLSSPERYRAVFTGFDSPQLLASIKHGPADFFRLLPHNPTLGLPGPAQIIELQNRREYELFGMVPSAVAPLHQDVLRHAASNPRFAGVWAWNSTGGWGGGHAALGEEGWSIWTELSSALTAALVRDPALDAPAFVRGWCATAFGAVFGAAVADVYLESAALIEQGWYPPRSKDVSLGALVIPPLLWVWWMRPTAAPLIWAYLAATIADQATARRMGAAAVERLAWHAERLAELAPAADPRAAALAESVHYLHDAIAVAQAIHALMLPAFTAAWENRRSDWDTLAGQARALRTSIQRHQASWGARQDLPALELQEIAAFLQTFQHAPGRLWLQARMVCLLVGRWRTRMAPSRWRPIVDVRTTLLVLLMANRSGRYRAVMAAALAAWWLAAPLRQRGLRAALPWLNRRLNLLPSIFFEAGPSLTGGRTEHTQAHPHLSPPRRLVVPQQLVQHGAPGVMRGRGACGLPQLHTQLRRLHQPKDLHTQIAGAAWRKECAGDTIAQQVERAAGPRRHDRQARGHSLLDGLAEGLAIRGNTNISALA